VTLAILSAGCSQTQSPEEYAKALAASVQPQLPSRDDVSELRTVEANGREVLHSFYFVEIRSDDPALPSLSDRIHEITQRNTCGNSQATRALDLGLTLRHVYYAADGPEVIDVAITSESCK